MATVTARSYPWYAPVRMADVWRRVRRYPLVPIGMLTFLLVIPAVLAPQVAPHDPLKGSLAKRLKAPVWQAGGSLDYPLGTDKLGRDILSRIIHGARVSLAVSLVAILVGGAIGTALGLISGYFGRWVDSLIMRLVDISLSLPTILLALVLVAAVGPSFGTVITVLVVAVVLAFTVTTVPTAGVAQDAKTQKLVFASAGFDESNRFWVISRPDHLQYDPFLETLLEVDPKTGEYTPRLAEKWSASADFKEWTFHLRKGVQFHFGYGM